MQRQRWTGHLRALIAAWAFAMVILASHMAMATPLASANHTQRSVEASARKLNITPERDFSHAWTESGDITARCRSAAQDLLNLYRYVAGVNQVSFTAKHNAEAQAASKVMTLTGEVAHNLTQRPAGISDEEWTLARYGAASSNLFNPSGKGIDHVLKVYMDDPGTRNEGILGHRRWMTSPLTAASGYGADRKMTALSVTDLRQGPAYVAVAWPATQTPSEFWTQGSDWSLSLPKYQGDNARVTLMSEATGQIWTFSTQDGTAVIEKSPLGDAEAVIWNPEGLKASYGDSYRVSVTVGSDVTSYRVSFFESHFISDTPDKNWSTLPNRYIHPDAVPVWRLYNRWSGEHLYVTNPDERFGLVSIGWSDEGVSFETPKSGTVKVRRLYNRYSGEHLFTEDRHEYEHLMADGWTGEGEAFRAFDESARNSKPIYRLYNPYGRSGSQHLFTADPDEYERLGTIGWRREGVALLAMGDYMVTLH